jgi:hypothetical protein
MAKRKTKLWASVLAAVPLAALIWGIYSYFASQKSPLVPEVRYVLFTADDLTDFVKPDQQKQILGELPIPRPLLIHNALFETLSSSFAPSQIKQSGRTVDTAVFLAVTNAGEQQAANVSFHSQDSIPDFHHLGKGESVLLCVELDSLNGKIVKLPIDEVSLSTANGHTYSVRVEPVPDRSAMAAVPGNRKGVFLGYPKYSK